MPRILRANLSELKITVEALPGESPGLGGRGLTSHILNKEVSPKTDPLGVDNKLILSGGILAGTMVPCNGRLSVGQRAL